MDNKTKTALLCLKKKNMGQRVLKEEEALQAVPDAPIHLKAFGFADYMNGSKTILYRLEPEPMINVMSFLIEQRWEEIKDTY